MKLKNIVYALGVLAVFVSNELHAQMGMMPPTTPLTTTMPTSPGTPGAPTTPTMPSTCDVASATSMCQKNADREFLISLIATLGENAIALGGYKMMLSSYWQQLDQAEKQLLGVTDSFGMKLTGMCAVAGIEGVAVAKVAKLMMGACAAGNFAYQCSQVGATTQEITKYISQNKEVAEAIVSISQQTASITGKTTSPGGSLLKSIPIIGGWCRAHDWGTQIFTAPEIIAEIGRGKATIARTQGKVDALIRDNQKLIDQANERLRNL